MSQAEEDVMNEFDAHMESLRALGRALVERETLNLEEVRAVISL